MSIARLFVDQGIEGALQIGTGRPFALVEGPTTLEGQGIDDLFPYGVIDPLDDTEYEEDFAASWSLAEFPYAVTSCGQTVDQATWLAGKADAVMLHSVQLTEPGYRIIGRRPDGGMGKPRKEANNFYTVRTPYRIKVTTA